MTVKCVIAAALKMLCRGETAKKTETGAQTDDEENELIKTLICCYNAVEDEIARGYVPLVKHCTMQSENGKFYFGDFLETPLKIISVKAYGVRTDYKIFADYLYAEANKITVEYAFVPAPKSLNSQCAFGFAVDPYLLAAGVCAEYCLINGEADAAGLWEKKYREGLQNLPCVKSVNPAGKLSDRRWV